MRFRSPESGAAALLSEARYRAERQAALADALERLGERSRAILRLVYVERVAEPAIAKTHREPRATVHRWLEEANDQLRATLRCAITERLGVAPDDVESVVRLVESQLDVSLERLLA